VTQTELQIISARATNLIARVRDPRIRGKMPGWVGIPTLPKQRPFVVSLERLELVTRGLTEASVRMMEIGEGGLYLRITGKDRDDRVVYRKYSLFDRLRAGNYPNVAQDSVTDDIHKWADNRRMSPRMLTKAKPTAGDVKATKVKRLEGKIRGAEECIRKLERQREKIREEKPWSPLVPREHDPSDYYRASIQRWILERPKRTLLGAIAHKYLRAGSVVQWKKMYAELEGHGIRPAYTYAKCHGWKHGPKSAEAYVREMKYWNLQNDDQFKWQASRYHLIDKCREHYKHLKEHADVIRQVKQVEGEIVAYQELIQMYREQVEEVKSC
jgi:hypothetical protein